MIELLVRTAARHPDAPCLISGDEQWSFASVKEAVLKGAALFADLGIAEGDHVVLAISNRPLFVWCWLALIARGAVAVPISHESFGDSLRYLATQSGSKLLISETGTSERLAQDLSGTSTEVLAFDGEHDFLGRVARFAEAEPVPASDERPASILYTSGTTGEPKGAVIPSRSYLAIGRKIVDAIGITASDRILTFLPLHHANPQMYSLMSALTAGCSVVILPRFSASTFVEQVQRFKPTGFTYVGTVLSILEKTIEHDFASTLRWCVGGGAPRAVWEALEPRLHLAIHELYGMTETGGMVTMNTREAHRFGSVGACRDDFDVAVVDDNDEPLPPGSIGEIVVRPKRPFVMTTGYYKKPTETVDATRNLWFHTGDLGRFDEQGFLFFEGRKKELIRRAGEMISPVEIELQALKHPQIADCAAVGVKDVIVEEEIKLAVVPRGAVTGQEIRAFLSRVLERHKLPRYVEFVDVIPKTPTQKVQRFKLTSNTPATVDLKQDAG